MRVFNLIIAFTIRNENLKKIKLSIITPLKKQI